MSPSCRSVRARGFTLVEVLVVLASLGMILWMVGQLLFPMRQAAERQRLQVEARQTARAATDYLTIALRGATDMNDIANPRNPAAILTFVWQGDGTGSGNNPTCDGTAQAGCIQVSYNNVTDASLAALGTDIVTVGRPGSTLRLRPLTWAGAADSSNPTWWSWDQGCPTDATNAAMFNQATQRDSMTNRSAPLMLFDAGGNWVFYQITDYKDSQNGSNCSSPPAQCWDVKSSANIPCIQVVANPGSVALNAPGGQRSLTSPVTLNVGVQYTSFRVCNGWLEQKAGIFLPAVDNNCPALAAGAPFPPYVTKNGWSPLLPNVEDLQVAYIFGNAPAGTLPGNGTVANGPAGTMATAAGVPVAVGGSPPTNALDVLNVTAVRVTVTARSTSEATIHGVAGGGKISAPQPAAEDHSPSVALTDTYYRSQITSLALLRNRVVGY